MEESKKKLGMHWALVLLISFGARFIIYFLAQFITPSALSPSLSWGLWSSHIATFTGFMLSLCLGRRRYFDSTVWRLYLILWHIGWFALSCVSSVNEIGNYISWGYRVSSGVKTLAIFLMITDILLRIIIYRNVYRHKKDKDQENHSDFNY